MNVNIPQLATIRITCNGDTGTAIIFFPAEDTNDVYILTAKHCLTGKNFNKEFRKEDISLDQIFNSIEETYHSYQLTETDIVITSSDSLDLALLILPKQKMVELIGKPFYYQIIDTDRSITDYTIRGFANFNDQETDRPFPLKYLEDQKDKFGQFAMRSEQQLDTYYQQALENVEGLSGSGAFVILNNSVYLIGIVHSYENVNLFSATKVFVFNQLIPDKFRKIITAKPELSEAVINSFSKVDKNLVDANSNIKDTVGIVNISRDTKKLLQVIKDSRLVVIHGKPGVGKSALAKACIAQLKDNGATILAFTPERLYTQTFSDALLKSGYSASLEQIIGSPLIGNRVLIWIESFEKLVESGFEGAFNDLLSMLKKWPQLSVLVTIRDYLLQKFKITYQFELPEQVVFNPVSEFNDAEILKIREAIPDLGPLLDNEKIHHLLRTPYYLDKAARIIPQLLGESQLDESTFKKLMWQHIIEVGNKQRGVSFLSVCLKRAREMSLFTHTDESEIIINDLVRDNLLRIENSETADRYSPSHDILEDWALVRFIKQQYQESSDPKTFITTLETSPAISRAFRLWLDEFYKQELEASASFVHTLLLDPHLAQTWKDELLIASLRSNNSTTLIHSLKQQLLADDGAYLRRVMRLLQTGCRTIDPKSRNFEQSQPVGSGWDVIIIFLTENLEIIEGFDNFELQYLSVIDGWGRQLPDFGVKVLPPAANCAAILLKNYIQKYEGRNNVRRRSGQHNSLLKPLISILFKLTGALPEDVKELIDAACNPEMPNENWTNKDTLEAVRGYMIDGVMSDQICRYFPDAVFYVASQEWLLKPKTERPHSRMFMFDSRPNLDDFGLDEDINHRYNFPSGYQTFFYWMYRHHPDKALDFLIPFLNSAFQKNQEVLAKAGYEIKRITIKFPDNSSQTYFGNDQYWSMYRGVNSRSTLIASLLMGLEAGLLDLADQGDEKCQIVRLYLERLIKNSNNVAILGVVVSVLQACPALLDEISVPIFGVPIFYRWDGSRSNSELVSSASYILDPFQKQERIKSNQRSHRKRHYLGMVGFVADYMFYYRTHNDKLFREVDAMWAAAVDGDQLWRKFLFDMDARRYNFKPIEITGYENMVQLVPGYDDVVNQTIISARSGDEFVPLGNSLWAKNAFDNEKMTDKTYDVWKSGFNFLRSPQGGNYLMAAPGTMAAVGLRDFYEKMELEEIVWCREELMKQGEQKLHPNNGNGLSFDFFDETSVMIGLSFVFKGESEESVQNRAKEIIFRLLIHGIERQAKRNLEAGISYHLFQLQPLFASNMWYGMLKLIEFKKAQYKAKELSYYESDEEIEPINTERQEEEFNTWREDLVKCVVDGTIVLPENIVVTLDMQTYRFQDDALRMIPIGTQLDAHHDFISQLLKLHIDFLNDPRQRDKYRFHDSRDAFTFIYARYLLNQPQERSRVLFNELLDLTLTLDGSEEKEKLSNFLRDLVKEHIRAVNSGAPIVNFWLLWQDLRDWLIEHKRAFLMPLLLMDLDWSEDSDGWHVLDGKNLFYKDFILDWGFNLINTTIKFLNGIAFNKFMPESINWVASMLGSTNANQVDLKIAGRFIEKAFYKYGSKIKGNKSLLNEYLFILDFLIDKGSSKAYMLKEELIQYK